MRPGNASGLRSPSDDAAPHIGNFDAADDFGNAEKADRVDIQTPFVGSSRVIDVLWNDFLFVGTVSEVGIVEMADAASCIVTPMPTAGPFTAQITGFRHL